MKSRYLFRQPKVLFIVMFPVLLIILLGCYESPYEGFIPDTLNNLIPKPVSVVKKSGGFHFQSDTIIFFEPDNLELQTIALQFSNRINKATGYQTTTSYYTGAPLTGNVLLKLIQEDMGLGNEGYELDISSDYITIQSNTGEGVYRGLQTLRQLFKVEFEGEGPVTGPWIVPCAHIRDYPRFEWRGIMLDVARHFFTVEEVKAYIEAMSLFKINRFHLHLTDDQGWRIMINSWPNLAIHGGSTEVGGGPGGYYTQEEYSQLVDYAQERYITLVPEIDMPGHTNAALSSYAELNCDDIAPPLYTGIEVGFSSLCVSKPITNNFVEEVLGEISALTPGDYIHIGGDEVHTMDSADYVDFIENAQNIVEALGKTMIGWEEIAQIAPSSSTVAQHWVSILALFALQKDMKLIMSPAPKAYLDMKYNADTPIGLSWAGYLDVKKAYDWEPVDVFEDATEQDILGVEAPLWTETVETIEDVFYMTYPRLCGYAEIGWSPNINRDWMEYKERLAYQGRRLSVMAIPYYASPLITWK